MALSDETIRYEVQRTLEDLTNDLLRKYMLQDQDILLKFVSALICKVGDIHFTTSLLDYLNNLKVWQSENL